MDADTGNKRTKNAANPPSPPFVKGGLGGFLRLFTTFTFALVLLLPSCGYRLSGLGGLVPEGAKSIAVPTFVNGTREPSVDIMVTQAVVDEFLADGRLKITDPERADIVLKGKVVKYDVTALSYTKDESFVQQYRVMLVVDASLEDPRSRKMLWQEKGIEAIFISDYPISYEFNATLGKDVVNIRETKISKEAAIKKASQDIAWTLRSRVLEGF
jgi:outer membrane lipopolysaccharide assembly protein LptE/RlpB